MASLEMEMGLGLRAHHFWQFRFGGPTIAYDGRHAQGIEIVKRRIDSLPINTPIPLVTQGYTDPVCSWCPKNMNINPTGSKIFGICNPDIPTNEEIRILQILKTEFGKPANEFIIGDFANGLAFARAYIRINYLDDLSESENASTIKYIIQQIRSKPWISD